MNLKKLMKRNLPEDIAYLETTQRYFLFCGDSNYYAEHQTRQVLVETQLIATALKLLHEQEVQKVLRAYSC